MHKQFRNEYAFLGETGFTCKQLHASRHSRAAQRGGFDTARVGLHEATHSLRSRFMHTHALALKLAVYVIPIVPHCTTSALFRW
jgi:hypothetical protein